ncbi:uncharacterized protein LOC34622136 [Cyclospora cayetanensis]|uniref:Uncharacterized protein LOC34622136 n=1 Tax=Cyclospora cayetanensis TaxID=88456 RepID=A0A6P6RYM3_9EIME|nr:uncharacterized protein LOC34622136 [Cyclospora cayetanensis]
MSPVPEPSWWRPYERAPPFATGDPEHRFSAAGHRTPTLQSCEETQPSEEPFSLEHSNEDSDGLRQSRRAVGVAGAGNTQRPQPFRGRSQHRAVSTSRDMNPGSPLTFRNGQCNRNQFFEVLPQQGPVRRCVQPKKVPGGASHSPDHRISASSRPHSTRDSCRLNASACVSQAQPALKDQMSFSEGVEALALESEEAFPAGNGLAENPEGSDRLTHVERILEKLLYEAKVLKKENLKLRAARKDAWGAVTGRPHEAKSPAESTYTAILKCQVDMLKRQLRDQEEEIRSMHDEADYLNACCPKPGELGTRHTVGPLRRHTYKQIAALFSSSDIPVALALTEEAEAEELASHDPEALRRRLQLQTLALKQSQQEAAELREELGLMRCNEASRKAELEDLQARCIELREELAQRQQEVRSCATEAVIQGAEAAAARGAQIAKTRELEQTEKRLQSQLKEQLDNRLRLQAENNVCRRPGKAEQRGEESPQNSSGCAPFIPMCIMHGVDARCASAQVEAGCLRATLRSLEERSALMEEQLRNRQEEVTLLQERVSGLCRERERDATALQQQSETLRRWRSYIRFLEKLIRDLRGYIVNQAACSAPLSVCDGVQRPAALSGGPSRKSPGSGLSGISRKDAGQEMQEALAAVGYDLLPLPLNPYEPSVPLSCRRLSGGGGLPRPGRLARAEAACRNSKDGSPAKAAESGTVEQLRQLMRHAAQELRVTAAAAACRRASSSRRVAQPRVALCAGMPAGGSVSSPGSTEASCSGRSEESVRSLPSRGSPSVIRRSMHACVEGIRRGRRGSPARTIGYEAPAAREGGLQGYSDTGSQMDPAGSLSDLSSYDLDSHMDVSLDLPWGRTRRLGALNKSAAAAKLAREIAVRFPSAFERLQKTHPRGRQDADTGMAVDRVCPFMSWETSAKKVREFSMVVPPNITDTPEALLSSSMSRSSSYVAPPTTNTTTLHTQESSARQPTEADAWGEAGKGGKSADTPFFPASPCA